MYSSRLPRPAASGPAWPDSSTNTRPCHSVTGSSTRPHSAVTNPGRFLKPAAARRSPYETVSVPTGSPC